MIASIKHKGLRLLWVKNDASKLPATQIRKIRNILTLLNGAAKVEDLNFPGSGLHSLKGDLKGYWSVSVSGNYRIIFRFEKGDAHLVDYTDYR
jgi:proteic killer suppression protein